MEMIVVSDKANITNILFPITWAYRLGWVEEKMGGGGNFSFYLFGLGGGQRSDYEIENLQPSQDTKPATLISTKI